MKTLYDIKTTDEFITEARKIHGNKYDYSKVEYVDIKTKVCIVCHQKDKHGKEHGEFWQTPLAHLEGRGCKRCACGSLSAKTILTTEQFIEKARKVHGDKYDYSKVDYKLSSIKICIVCPEHGEFYVTPNNHLRGKGCPKCVGKHKTTSDFVVQANKIHSSRYDYSKTTYVNATTKICIICPEHGEFWQTPNKHLSGEGCPNCKNSVLELKMSSELKNSNIEYIHEYKNSILGKQRLDFYLPKQSVAIECQGRQHFNNNGYFFNSKKNNEEEFKLVRERDVAKNRKCSECGITVLYLFPQNISIRKILEDYNSDGIYNRENSFNKPSDIVLKIKGGNKQIMTEKSVVNVENRV